MANYICISLYSFFQILFHYSLSQDIEYSSLCCTVNWAIFLVRVNEWMSEWDKSLELRSSVRAGPVVSWPASPLAMWLDSWAQSKAEPISGDRGAQLHCHFRCFHQWPSAARPVWAQEAGWWASGTPHRACKTACASLRIWNSTKGKCVLLSCRLRMANQGELWSLWGHNSPSPLKLQGMTSTPLALLLYCTSYGRWAKSHLLWHCLTDSIICHLWAFGECSRM